MNAEDLRKKYRRCPHTPHPQFGKTIRLYTSTPPRFMKEKRLLCGWKKKLENEFLFFFKIFFHFYNMKTVIVLTSTIWYRTKEARKVQDNEPKKNPLPPPFPSCGWRKNMAEVYLYDSDRKKKNRNIEYLFLTGYLELSPKDLFLFSTLGKSLSYPNN